MPLPDNGETQYWAGNPNFGETEILTIALYDQFNGACISLKPGSFHPTSPLTPAILDERAKVVHLSRNIIIQGADDAYWILNGFGVHIMVSGDSSVVQVDGIQI
eukprot:5460129-Ditylum_brightwellii.AAC.1